MGVHVLRTQTELTEAVEASANLEHIFAITAPNAWAVLKGYDLEGRNILTPSIPDPDLTEEPIGVAVSVIPTDYWSLACWKCREKGHTMFSCPHLTLFQRVYFAYGYYLHQVAANPNIKPWMTRSAPRSRCVAQTRDHDLAEEEAALHQDAAVHVRNAYDTEAATKAVVHHHAWPMVPGTIPVLLPTIAVIGSNAQCTTSPPPSCMTD